MYLNKLQVIGNLAKDPEIKALPSGMKVATLNIGTNRSWKDKDGQKQEKATWFQFIAFGKTAETLGQYAKKGGQLMIEARMENANYEKDGVKMYKNDFIIESFQFGSSPKKDGESEYKKDYSQDTRSVDDKYKAWGSDTSSSSENIKYPTENIDLDDIPF